MRMRSFASLSIVLSVAAALTTGCDAPAPMAPPAPSQPDATAAASGAHADQPAGASKSESKPSSTDAWVGRWNGPEGTYLLLEGGQGRYTVTIANLDEPRQFEGRSENSAAADKIVFTRDGEALSLHATDGAGTGMKWLAEKQHCLTVRPGEGYCRD